MRSPHISRILAGLALPLLFSVVFGAQAQPNDLDLLLTSGRYSEASQVARQMPSGKVISLLSSAATSRNAPAQWLLADTYWRAGQKEKAVYLGYEALVSTQLDASVCRYNTKVAAWMMQSYEPIFREARRRPHLQAQAIQAALESHAASPTMPIDNIWACALGAHLEGKTNSPSATRIPSESTMERKRRYELESLIEKAGLQISIE